MHKLFPKPLGIFSALVVLATPLLAGNVLVNAGFESDAPGENQNLVGWTTYGPNNFSETGSPARSGSNYLKVFQGYTSSVNYSGIYQDYSAGAGTTCTADGWVKLTSTNLLAGHNQAWMEVTFRDADTNMLALYRSRIINPGVMLAGGMKDAWLDLPITNQYDPNSYTITGTAKALVAPPGTSFVRYQVVMEGDAANSAGAVFFDDLNLNVTKTVPAASPVVQALEGVEPTGETPGEWHLVWSDEFNQSDGSAPDATKWGYDLGGSGWGNNELEYYTDRTNNARIEDGKLVIEAKQEKFGGKDITSARLLTKDKKSWAYGRMEARIKIPRGQGIWPAFWMLGANITSVPWPACGEIDIMENIGKEPGTVHGTVHGPGYSGANGIGGPVTLPGGAAFADDFHVFAVEWETNRIRWFMDGKNYFVITPSKLPRGKPWVYTQPQFLILNLAVGGGWPGNPNATTTFPQRMTVDYVRVYSKSPLAKRNSPATVKKFN